MTGKMNPMTGSLEEDWETEPHDLCVVWNTMQYHAILSVAFMCIATSAVYAFPDSQNLLKNRGPLKIRDLLEICKFWFFSIS